MPSSWPKSGGMPCRREPAFMPEGLVASAPPSAAARPPSSLAAPTRGATLAADDHDAGEPRGHRRYTAENSDGLDLC